MSAAQGIHIEEHEGEGAPSWSGIPVIAEDCMILPLHVADTRQITFGPEWTHIDHWPSEGGDTEYHVYRRLGASPHRDAIALSALPQPEPGE